MYVHTFVKYKIKLFYMQVIRHHLLCIEYFKSNTSAAISTKRKTLQYCSRDHATLPTINEFRRLQVIDLHHRVA